MNKPAKVTLALGAALVAAGVLYNVLQGPTANGPGHPPPSNYCTDSVYYTRACEDSPFSVASGTPGYGGQICGAHTYAWVGTDLFTYPILDQDFHTPYRGRTYARPPVAAGTQAQAVWDQCYVLHQSLGAGYPCTANPPSGTLNYVTRTWAQLPPGPQKTAWGNKYGCFSLTPSPSLTPTVIPSQTPAAVPTPCPTCAPAKIITVVVTASPSPHFTTAVPRTPSPFRVGCLALFGGKVYRIAGCKPSEFYAASKGKP